MRYTIFAFLLILGGTTIKAQADFNLDQVHKITQSTYDYKSSNPVQTILKYSVYDTNQVLVNQDRYNYFTVDTGIAVSTHYHFEYDPRYQTGTYFTEKPTHASKPKREYSKQLTKFRTTKNPENRTWIKTYKENSKSLQRHTENKFDTNGFLTETIITNYKTKPPTQHIEKVVRNNAGNMLQWQSFDDDGETKKVQARDFSATYKNDTLLLKSAGYLYNNWKSMANKYSGKNELKKSIEFIGNRAPNGKIKKLDKNITIYKNGRPYKTTAKKLNKKVKTINYAYAPGSEVWTVVTPEKSYTERKDSVFIDSLGLLTKYTETKEGNPFLEINITYDTTGQIKQHTEIEYRKNGKDWKTVKEYNEHGSIVTKSFYVADKLRRKDTYQYEYFPPKPAIIEVEEEEIED